MAEAKKTPAEVWKILPLKHKIISVIAAVATVAIFLALMIFVIFPALEPEISTIIGERPSGRPSEEQYLPPVILQYTDRDGKQQSAYSHPGRITIITEKDTAPEAIRALVKSMGATIDVEIPNSDLYFASGFDGRESAAVSSLLQNPLVADAFPTPVWSAKGLYLIEDYSTLITPDGKYLHYNNADGTFSWRTDAAGALSHGKLVELLAGISGKNSKDVAVPDGRDKYGNVVYEMNVARGLEWVDKRAGEEGKRGEVTVVSNSWGANLKEVPQEASAAERRQAKDSFLGDEKNSYRILLQFLEGNPNAIALKAAGNEELDISSVLADAKAGAGDKWKRLIIVGALDSNLNPTDYSNRAVGLTDILWVPQLTAKDGSPVTGTSFTTPQISKLLNRIARERPDLSADQIASILFDERVSPRVNLRPTIVDPLSEDTFNKAIEVARERFPPSKTVTPTPTPPTTKPTLEPGGLTPARDLTGTWRNPISGQGLILYSTVTDDLLPEEEADISVHFDVEWNITQSGNTVAGPVALKFVKASGRWASTYPDVIAGYKQTWPGTYFWTGTVEGTSITIDFYWGFSDPPKPLKGSFTTDLITAKVYISPAEERAWYEKQPCPEKKVGDIIIPCPIPLNLGNRAKLSLSRVW